MDPVVARERLLEARATAQARLTGLVATFDDVVEASRDSNADDEHDPEGSTIAAERSLVTSLADGTRDSLAAIDAALGRLDAGTFGTCVTCGEPIADDRLEARPATPVCIVCA